MNYQTFDPQPDLSALVKCHWILEVPADVLGINIQIRKLNC
jgi:hypothetical protein